MNENFVLVSDNRLSFLAVFNVTLSLNSPSNWLPSPKLTLSQKFTEKGKKALAPNFAKTAITLECQTLSAKRTSHLMAKNVG
jgi:hypothetical protein